MPWHPGYSILTVLMNSQSSLISFVPPAVSEETPQAVPQKNAIPEITAVVPIFKSEASLPELLNRLKSSLSSAASSWEIVFVDDASPDNCWEIISEAARHDKRVRAVKLSRNFGQHAAITAGLSASRGNWIVVMDADLQEPPEKIPELHQAGLKGSDIVFARRVKRKDFRRDLSAKIYFKFLNAFAQTNICGEYGTFSLISRQVKDEYLRLSDHNRHYLFILYWLGFEKTSVDFDHLPRQSGKSSYTMTKLIRHALQGAFFQSTVLLEGITFLGFVLSAIGLFSALILTIAYFQHGALPGWTSIAVILLMVGGANITAVGVVGLYIGQIFEQVKGRPIFVVSKQLNLPVESEVAPQCQ